MALRRKGRLRADARRPGLIFMRWSSNSQNPSAMMAIATALVLAAGACGGGKGAAMDAAADAGSGGDVAVDTGAASCDPALQDCASGSECDFSCEGGAAVVACRPDNGNGAVGAACSPSMPCGQGSACIGSVDAGVICRKYCSVDGDCATGQRCHNDNVSINCGTPVSVLLLHTCY
jgi:hypothetical protein